MEPVLRLALRTRKLPVVARYAITAALTLIALGARWLLLGPQPGWAFVSFYPVVALAGLIFDRGTGVFATAFSAMLGVFFFTAPVGQFAVAGERDFVGLLIFLGTAGFIALLTEGMRTTFERMIAAQESLELANRRLHSANSRLEQTESQTAMLLHETIHRFRNDLQRLSSTVALQMSTSSDPAAKAALMEVQGRIAALAAIKARLDMALMPEGGTSFVESRTFLSGLVEDWDAAIGIQAVSFRAEAESHLLPAHRTVLLGLILNELMTNAVKYAFPDDRPGTVAVTFRRVGEDYRLEVEDDGIGHDPTAAPKGTGLGRRITQGLAAQMGGRLEIGPRAGGGTSCRLTVPTSLPGE